MLCDHKPALAQALPPSEFQDLLDGMQRLGISGASATGAPRRDALSPRRARATIGALARRRLWGGGRQRVSRGRGVSLRGGGGGGGGGRRRPARAAAAGHAAPRWAGAAAHHAGPAVRPPLRRQGARATAGRCPPRQLQLRARPVRRRHRRAVLVCLPLRAPACLGLGDGCVFDSTILEGELTVARDGGEHAGGWMDADREPVRTDRQPPATTQQPAAATCRALGATFALARHWLTPTRVPRRTTCRGSGSTRTAPRS